MSSKETILEALKANSPAPVERGPLGFTPMTFSDPLAEFRERAVKAAAARCILIEEGDDKASADTELSGNRATSSGDRTPEEDKSGSIRERIASIVRRTYPEARRIASNLPEAASCATFNPDELEDPRDLAGTDVAIVRGAFGVVENGAVWIPRAFRHKAMLFIPETSAASSPAPPRPPTSSRPLSSAPTEPGTSRSSCCRPSARHSSSVPLPQRQHLPRFPAVAAPPFLPPPSTGLLHGIPPPFPFHNGSISRDYLPLRCRPFRRTLSTGLLHGIPTPFPFHNGSISRNSMPLRHAIIPFSCTARRGTCTPVPPRH